MHVIETTRLAIGYKTHVLSDDISICLPQDKFIGLIGQNGVGKSTFIRTLAGLQPKISGQITLCGAQIDTLKSHERAKHIAVVLPQKPQTLNLTVTEFVSLGRYVHSGWMGSLHQMDKEKIRSSIDTLEISSLISKKLYELSDGQLQKVMIAKALAQDSDAILLDEPTSHLDLKNKVEILNLLKKVALSGKSILISTHEIQYASQVCDLFWCMDFGKDILVGIPQQLIANGQVQDYLHINRSLL